MSNPTNPSQEEPKQGVFSSIQGAHSRDSEAAEETAKTETAEPTKPVVEPGEADKKVGDERLGKALQRAAQLERQINQLGPWAQFGMAVGNDPKGKSIVERYQKGQELFLDEEDLASMTASEVQARNEEKPLTRQELADYMQQKEAAAHVAQELNAVAEEELPEFKRISKGREFAEFLDWATRAVWNGSIPLDESVVSWDNDYAAKQYTALKKAYKMKLASDPKVLEAAKKAGEKEAKERAEEAAAVPSSVTTTTSSQEEPGEKTEADKAIDRMLNVRGRGKSFASVGAKR